MDIPDWPGDGVRWEVTSIRSICERFIKIWQQELCHITNVLLKIFISKICIFEHFHRGWMPPKSTFLGSKSTRFSVPIHQKNNGGVKKLPRLPSSLRGVFFETPCSFNPPGAIFKQSSDKWHKITMIQIKNNTKTKLYPGSLFHTNNFSSSSLPDSKNSYFQ